MLTRPNRQSWTAVSGRIAALADGGGELFCLCNHCRSDTISKLRSCCLGGVRGAAPQSIMLGVEDEEMPGDGCVEEKCVDLKSAEIGGALSKLLLSARAWEGNSSKT